MDYQLSERSTKGNILLNFPEPEGTIDKKSDFLAERPIEQAVNAIFLENHNRRIRGGQWSNFGNFSSHWTISEPVEYINITNSKTLITDVNIHLLNEKIKIELARFGYYITSEYTTAIRVIDEVKFQLAGINFLDASVELTPSNSITFKLLLPRKILLIIDKPLGVVDDLENDEVVISLKKDKDSLFTDVKTITDVVEGANKLLLL